ncbi:MAG: class II aldolase/adducin family protein, partial [Candidatus Omnitrophica bacterium]|nr:class II aldolase/adducin family protein [Candidatus Omnitrophota bacterium]
MRKIKKEMIKIGRKLYDLRLVVASGGNLSYRLDRENILITSTGSSLGNLGYKDIIKVNLKDERNLKNKPLSSEFPLHRLIYKNFSTKVVIHAHPPLTNGYFAIYSQLKPLTFEAKLYLANIPVVEQETPTITRPELVVEALKLSNLVVIKNHGVVSMADNFTSALYLIEELEAAIKTIGIARLLKKEILDD